MRWEIGLLYNPIQSQIPLSLPTEQDIIELDPPSDWETMQREYMAVDLHTNEHIMANLRNHLEKNILTSKDVVGLDHGTKVTVAGFQPTHPPNGTTSRIKSSPSSSKP